MVAMLSRSEDNLYEIFEWLTCNSDHEFVQPEETGDLTSAPLLGRRDEQGNIVQRWGFMDYQLGRHSTIWLTLAGASSLARRFSEGKEQMKMAQWPSEEFLEIQPPRFQPFVFVKTKLYSPTSVAMAAVGGWGLKIINLPETFTADNLPKVQEIVRKHFVENQGGIPLWHEIEGYFFVFTPSEGILLDVDGNLIGRRTGKYHPQSIAIQKEL